MQYTNIPELEHTRLSTYVFYILLVSTQKVLEMFSQELYKLLII